MTRRMQLRGFARLAGNAPCQVVSPDGWRRYLLPHGGCVELHLAPGSPAGVVELVRKLRGRSPRERRSRRTAPWVAYGLDNTGWVSTYGRTALPARRVRLGQGSRARCLRLAQRHLAMLQYRDSLLAVGLATADALQAAIDHVCQEMPV